MVKEKRLQLRRVVNVAGFRVHTQKNLSIRFQKTALEVIQQKPPFLRSPQILRLVSVEADRKGCHQIKSFVQLRKLLKGFYPPDSPLQAEHLEQVFIHWGIVDIQAQSRMAEISGNQQEIASTAAQV